MQPELIDQCLLDLLVQDKKTVGVDGAAFEFERCRHVAIDVDRLTVEAIAGKIRNVMLAIKLLHSSAEARSIIRLETYHSGNLSFSCGAVG